MFLAWDTPCFEDLSVLATRGMPIPLTTVDRGNAVSISVAQTMIATLLARGCPEWVALPGQAVIRETDAESYQNHLGHPSSARDTARSWIC